MIGAVVGHRRLGTLVGVGGWVLNSGGWEVEVRLISFG